MVRLGHGIDERTRASKQEGFDASPLEHPRIGAVNGSLAGLVDPRAQQWMMCWFSREKDDGRAEGLVSTEERQQKHDEHARSDYDARRETGLRGGRKNIQRGRGPF